jgi:FtsZ-binding cell division protein ZapB
MDMIDEMDKMAKTEVSTSALEEKVKIITNAMEKMVLDIKKLKEENKKLKTDMIAMKQQVAGIAMDFESVQHDVGADMDARAWMLETAPEDATDVPLTGQELARKIGEYEQQHRDFGYDHHGF